MTTEQVQEAANRLKAMAQLEFGEVDRNEGGHPFLIIVFGKAKHNDPMNQTPACIRSNVAREAVEDILEFALAQVKGNG